MGVFVGTTKTRGFKTGKPENEIKTGFRFSVNPGKPGQHDPIYQSENCRIKIAKTVNRSGMARNSGQKKRNGRKWGSVRA